jgi:hypothetical protein
MADYADIEELIAGYLPGVTSDEDKAALASMITRASRAIDTQTRRPANAFAPAADSTSAQVFYGDGAAVLLLPEFVTGSVETVSAPTGYMPPGYAEFRRREVSTGGLRVGLHTATAITGGILTPRVPWAKGVPYTVKARWGFLATPPEIVEACFQLVRHWWRQQSGEVSGAIGDMERRRGSSDRSGFPRGVEQLIASYILDDVAEDSEAGTVERGDLLNSDYNSGGGWGSL